MHADAGHAQPGPSTGGHTLEMGNVTIHAMSGQHHATTLASSDAEMYELSRGVAVMLAMREFLTEIGLPQLGPSRVQCDNISCILKADSALSEKRSLYMKRRGAFVQEAQLMGEIDVVHVPGEDNRADILTKPLPFKVFAKHRDAIMNVAKMALNVHSAISMLARALWRPG